MWAYFGFENCLSHKLFSKKDLVEIGVNFTAFCRKILGASRVQLVSIVCTFASMDNISWSNIVQLASVPSTSFMKHPRGKSCSTSRLKVHFLQVQSVSSYTFAAALRYPDRIGKTLIFWRGPWITINKLSALDGKTSLF